MNHFSCTGRLTRDPEVRSLASGKQVAKFGLAIKNRKKNQQTGEWEDDAVFVDFEAWEKKAELISEHYGKGDFILITKASLRLDRWEKDGEPRSKLYFVVDDFEFLPGPRREGDDDEAPAKARGRGKSRSKAASGVAGEDADADAGIAAADDPSYEKIPF